MSFDYAKKEREFLANLKNDSGFALDEWLSRIAAENFSDRNDIIDWLRQHGFTFSRASWLERIYHNGGQPIYAGAGQASETSEPQSPTRGDRVDIETVTDDAGECAGNAKSETADAEPARPKAPKLTLVKSEDTIQKPATVEVQDEAPLEATLARAKGLRPLAQHVVREIQKAVPDVVIDARTTALAFSQHGHRFAILAVSAKDLRLGLQLAERTVNPPFDRPTFGANLARISEKMTHMLILDDVRQVDENAIACVRQAAERG